MATPATTGPVFQTRGISETLKFVRKAAFFVVLVCCSTLNSQHLKSIVYDFDGFDIGATDLPEGDYSYGDLAYQVAANPFAAGGQLGDRVLRIDISWNAGYGAFGRGISRFLELSIQHDRLNFFFAHGTAGTDSVPVEIIIADDDNNSGSYESGNDDSWRYTLKIPPKSGWQLCSVPLSLLTDDNTGGNGVFDIGFQDGKLLLVELRFERPSGASGNVTCYIDMLCFSEGQLPQGTTPTALPAADPSDHCLLGAHMQESPGQFHLIPQHFHSLLPASQTKKIRYVNTYMQWATNGSSVPHMLPGNGYQQLLNGGYPPIITWDPMFSGYSATDPAQPSLDEIANGNFDSYIDAFATALKKLSDTVIIRLMHEFDGDWYPWSIANNGQDPSKYVNAFRHIVNRVKQKGAMNVQWMWCPNSDFSPQESWNWVVSAYPGNSYVDIVATDVYNAHYPPSQPWWRSFRWQTAEVYYYLTKYFPEKPFFICENACRERKNTEPSASQDKAGWIAAMDRDLQSYFHKTRALVFFSEDKSERWSVNSSPAALNALRDHIWADDYYFKPLVVGLNEKNGSHLTVWPNPSEGKLWFDYPHNMENSEFQLVDMRSHVVFRGTLTPGGANLSSVPAGIYFLLCDGNSRALKVAIR